MKYKITQDQLNKIVFPFLDREFEGIEKYKVANIYRSGRPFISLFFFKPKDIESILEYTKYYPEFTLFISHKLVDKIHRFFSLDEEDVESLVARWSIDRLKIDVEHTVIEYGNYTREDLNIE